MLITYRIVLTTYTEAWSTIMSVKCIGCENKNDDSQVRYLREKPCAAPVSPILLTFSFHASDQNVSRTKQSDTTLRSQHVRTFDWLYFNT